jgi:hypothetical protein
MKVYAWHSKIGGGGRVEVRVVHMGPTVGLPTNLGVKQGAHEAQKGHEEEEDAGRQQGVDTSRGHRIL